MVEGAGVTNQVGLVLRRSPAFTLARQLLADPAAGRVMAVVLRDDQFIPTQGMYGSDWRADPDKAASRTDLIGVGFGDALVGRVRRECAVNELGVRGKGGDEGQCGGDDGAAWLRACCWGVLGFHNRRMITAPRRERKPQIVMAL